MTDSLWPELASKLEDGEDRPQEGEAPLAGIRVVEVAQNLAGPYCTRILQDLGAEVLKIEPPQGDAARRWGPPFHQGAGTIFALANAGKRSRRLDLSTTEGREALRGILKRADVLVHALRPGVMEALELGDEALAALNPRLVRFQVLAYGEEGPLAHLPGYEPLMQAHAGVMSYTGPRGGAPVRVGTSIVDMGTGMWGVVGILAALRTRDRTGRGSRVSGALFDTAVAWSGYHLLGAAADGTVPRPMGTELPMICPYGVFPCTDGEVMLAVGTDGMFRRLCGALGLDDLVDDDRFSTNPDRVANRDPLNRRVAGATSSFGVEALLSQLRSAGVPCAPVRNVGELLEDPQLAASGMLVRGPVPSDQPDRGRQIGVALPLRFEGRRPVAPTSVPTAGPPMNQGDSGAPPDSGA
mgnify:CR=1 FL=1